VVRQALVRAAAARRADVIVTVATYNIHRCIGTDGRYDATRVVEVLREIDAGIVALQEVENRGDATHDSLQLDYLATALQMQSVPGLRIVRHWKEYGNALLTRFPVLDLHRHNISVTWREPRGAIDATLDVDGSPLRVLATHLGLGRIERRFQTMQLARLIDAGDPALPCLVLGDMNEWFPYSRHLAWIDRRLGANVPRATFPSRWPFLKLDRLWLRPMAALTDVRVHTSPRARVASDHLPLSGSLDTARLGIASAPVVPLESRPLSAGSSGPAGG
jgi:endonuclease/exonuclease/phosphatase family metal-dependent hydrolase